MSERPSRRKSFLGALWSLLRSESSGASARKKLKPPGYVIEVCESRVLLSATALTSDDYVAGHVMFELKPNHTIDAVVAEFPSATVKPLGNYGLYLMTNTTVSDTLDWVGQVSQMPDVMFAEPDYISHVNATPNDPSYDELWGLNNIGQAVNGNPAGTADADIDADLAWNTSTGGPTIVAVIDTGVDYLHEDLIANIWTNTGEISGNGIDDDNNGYVDDVHGYDFGDQDSDPMDIFGHGTHCAGTIGAVGDNGVGVVGVNWNVKIMALKAALVSGGLPNSATIEALNYAVQMGATVSNNSYGGAFPSALVQTAIHQAGLSNHVFVASAGNSGNNSDFLPLYPAAYTEPNIISVAATDNQDQLASFSNYGLFSVDIGAPGVDILSTTPTNGSVLYAANYDFSDGTSMAGPHVAGAATFIRNLVPNLSFAQVKNALMSGADLIPSLTGRVVSGGRLNLNSALQYISAATISVSPSSIREDAGASASTITVRRAASNINTPLVMDLLFDDPSEVALPSLAGGTQITIPAGVNQITIPVDAVDDTLLDGTQTVTFDLRLNGASINTAQLSVTDVETLSISVSPGTIKENAGLGAATVTITRSNTDTNPPDTFEVVNNQLLRHDYQGALVSTIDIPWAVGASRPFGEDAHDLVTLANGRIAIYNGTSVGYVSIYNPANLSWQHFAIPGLSTDPTIIGTGGITAWGNYVFLSDMQNTNGDPFGAVRLDLSTGDVTRFATKSPGDRIFVTDIFSGLINEIDPITGVTINSIPMPVPNSAYYTTEMAFDGTNLWVLAGDSTTDTIYKVNAETGAILDVHHLGGTTGWSGLAWLNGLLYAEDDFNQNQITVYNPVSRRVVNTLNVNADISGGLAGITGPDALIASSNFRNNNTGRYDLYEIDPQSGIVKKQIDSGMTTPIFGIGAAGQQIFAGQFQGSDLRVFDRNGTFSHLVPISTVGSPGVSGIGGDDIQGITTTKYRYRDIFAGLDDQLYVLDNGGLAIGRFNPVTLELDTFFNVSKQVNAIAVAADGTIWGASADGNLYHFSKTGAVISSLATGHTDLIDIDLNVTGLILLTSLDGTVIETDTSLTTPTEFSAGSSAAFVTLGRIQTLPAGAVVVQLATSDPSEVSVPQQVIIPIGQQSVTVPVDAVDDNILDGTQIVTLTASFQGYINTPTATVNVLDAEIIGVDIVADQISEAAGNAATQVRVFRTNVDGPFSFVAQQSGTNTTPQTILDLDKTTSQITVPAQTSRLTDVNVTVSLKHELLTDVDIFLISPVGTRVELVTDVTSNGQFMTNTTFDDSGLGSILAGQAPFTGSFRPEGFLSVLNDQNPSGIWTLEITDDNQSDFGTLFSWSLNFQTVGLAPQAVTLSVTGDPGEISVQPTTVTIPANQAEILIPLNAVDDNLLDGTQIAGIDVTGVALGFEFAGDSVEVLDQETMNLGLFKSSVFENAGPGAIIGKLTRGNTNISLPYTVLLTSSNTNKLTVPVSVTIPANKSSVTFAINAIDNNIIDGNTLVTVTAIAPAYGADVTAVVNVLDLEPVLKLSTSTPTVAENLGSFTVVVERQDQADLSLPMTVTLTVGAGLSVPATVTIPANNTSVSFEVSVLDNSILDGTRSVTIHGAASSITDGDLVITITDYETLTISASKTTFLENAGGTASTGTVTRSNTGDLSQALLVTLSSSDTTEATVPATVTIPAGQASVSFPITAVNDPAVDGAQNVTVTATATSFVAGTIGLVVEDHEPPVITGPDAVTSVTRPTITWNALAGAIRYDVWISNLSSGVGQIVRKIDVRTNSFVPPENLGIGQYRVWVRAINSEEVAGFWSVGKDFFVNTPPVITSPSPAAIIANSSFPTITWSAVPDATKYELWVNNLTTKRARVIYLAGTSALTTTSYTTPNAMPSGTYKIWVRALNAQGEAGLWSVGTVHTVLAPPAISQPIGGGTFDRTPTFSWSAVTGATNYDLWVGEAKTGAVAIRNQFIRTTTFTALQDIAVGDYKVWVRAQSGNSYSSWSQVTQFSVGLPPAITSAKLVGNPARAQFGWTTIAGTEKYELRVTNKTTGVLVFQKTAINTTTYTHNAALAAGTYRVWVRAVSTMGEVTTWSSPVDLVIASAAESFEAAGSRKATILTSAFPKAKYIESESPVESPEAVVEDTLRIAEATVVVNNINALDEPAVVADPAIPSVDVTEAEFDAVMSEWQSADWWIETSDSSEKNDLKSVTALAASIGLVVRRGKDSDDRRKKRF